ncbi:ATP-binding protein [Streptomyces sp. NPDC017964]|uniref:ATP-binding protein n=1 Tax=Streptomyces sp. NPDC017964 TaxID=3365022 RepID=UPI0037B7825E
MSELATNVVRYGASPLRLRLIDGPTLTCEVSDSSLLAPHLRHAHTTDEGGRGLFICAELAHRWGARFTNQGKTIWTEQKMPSPAAAPRVLFRNVPAGRGDRSAAGGDCRRADLAVSCILRAGADGPGPADTGGVGCGSSRPVAGLTPAQCGSTHPCRMA